MSKKNKRTIACICVIAGALAIIGGIVLEIFISDDTNKNSDNKKHQPEKVEICKSIDYKEKTTFVLNSYDEMIKDKKPILLTSDENFYNELSAFEMSEGIEENFNFTENDYLFYFMSDNKNCSRSKYLTNYTFENNILNIEFTNSEFNISECNNEIFYAYVLAFDKNTINLENLTINVTNKEDPFKDCYK